MLPNTQGKQTKSTITKKSRWVSRLLVTLLVGALGLLLLPGWINPRSVLAVSIASSSSSLRDLVRGLVSRAVAYSAGLKLKLS
ncbi:hypothetical protein B0T19DRAFT_375222 [Cercophora scortea]|uniref:Uncharacterized protein n=1 Tax=Cercophora scortea TaxID=314031 RepID=A0AAE0M575_9PEZI|nr:hypothetical protein B0T19DRAFT_375222 [Cercophora scortea]